jgi:hypothetical protein
MKQRSDLPGARFIVWKLYWHSVLRHLFYLINNMKRIIILISMICFITGANAQKIPVTPSANATPSLFVENKGQWVPEARFKAELPYGAVFITDQGFVYNFVSQKDMEKVHELYEDNKGADVDNEPIRHYAYKVNFAGANTSTSDYLKNQKSKTYFNYFI